MQGNRLYVWRQAVGCLGLTMIGACATGATAKTGSATTMRAAKPRSKPMDTAREMVVRLAAGEILTIGSARHRPGAEPLMRAYFRAVGPIAGPHGFAAKGRLNVVASEANGFKPNNFVGFFSFPSKAASQRFGRDPRWPAVRAQRPKIWRELRLSHYEATGPAMLRFRSDKVYEVRYEWYTRPADGVGTGESRRTTDAGAGRVIATFIKGAHEMMPTSVPPPTRIRILEWSDLASAKSAARGGPGYQRVDALYTKVPTTQRPG